MPQPKSPTISKAERRRAQVATMSALRPVESQYANALRDIARAWAKAYMAELGPVLKARFDGKGEKLPSTFDMLGIRVEVAIEKHVGPLFDKMASKVEKTNAKQMSVMGITPEQTKLGKFVSERRKANIDLIKDTHAKYRDSLRELLEDPANFGMRSETLAKTLAERGEISEDHAELIARDQTLTLNGQITQERQTSAGVERYTWSTSLDDRVRPEHDALEGQTISWDDPPAVGHPGEDILCRCVAIPIIDELEGLYDDSPVVDG